MKNLSYLTNPGSPGGGGKTDGLNILRKSALYAAILAAMAISGNALAQVNPIRIGFPLIEDYGTLGGAMNDTDIQNATKLNLVIGENQTGSPRGNGTDYRTYNFDSGVFTNLEELTLSGNETDPNSLVEISKRNRWWQARILDVRGVDDVTIKNLYITGGTHRINSQDALGGGAVIDNFSKLNIVNSAFSTNLVSSMGTTNGAGGGGLYISNSGGSPGDATLMDVVIIGNEARATGGTAYGGGLLAGGYKSLTYTGGTIQNNEANGQNALGGGAHITSFGTGEQGKTIFDGTYFYFNTASGDESAKGGGLSIADKLDHPIDVTLKGVTFEFNKAIGYGASGFDAMGGGVYSENPITISKSDNGTISLFTGNDATAPDGEAMGGGLYVNGYGKLANQTIADISDTTFRGNSVNDTGPGGTGEGAYGGGFFIAGDKSSGSPQGEEVVFNNVTIIHNLVSASASGSGAGGVVKNVALFQMNGGLVEYNTILSGGVAAGAGLHITSVEETNITGVTFRNNEINELIGDLGPTTDARGAGLMIDNNTLLLRDGVSSTATLTDVKFIDNSITVDGTVAAQGGGIYATSVDLTIAGNSTFSGNSVNGDLNDIHVNRANLFLEPGAGKTITFDGGITGTHGSTVTMQGGGTIAFTNTSGDVVQNFHENLVATVKSGTTLQSGMSSTGTTSGDWKSNLTSTGPDALLFEKGAIWFVDAAPGYDGDCVIGEFNFSETYRKSAQAALDQGNLINPFFGFWLCDEVNDIYSPPGTYHLSDGRNKKANISDTASGIAAFISPGRLGTGAQGAFNSFVPRRQQQCAVDDYCGQSPRGWFSGNTAWVNWVGRSSEFASNYKAATGPMKYHSNGVQLGTDLYRGRCFQFGAMFGYESHEAALNGRVGDVRFKDRTTADDFYFGLYSQYLLGNNWDVRGALGWGWQNYDSKRYLLGRNNASFKGNTFETTVELGYRLRANRCLSFRPVIALDLIDTNVKAHQETGTYALGFGKSSLTRANLRFGSDVNYAVRRLVVNGGAYYAYNLGDDHTSVMVTNGVHSLRAVGTDLGRSTFTLNAGANYYLDARNRYSVFGNYFADIYADRAGSPMGHTGMVGLSAKF